MLYSLHDNLWSNKWLIGLTGEWKQLVDWVNRLNDPQIVVVLKRMEVFKIVSAWSTDRLVHSLVGSLLGYGLLVQRSISSRLKFDFGRSSRSQ